MQSKIRKMFRDFEIMAFLTCLENFLELCREYIGAAVNVLQNSPKILHLTKKDVF